MERKREWPVIGQMQLVKEVEAACAGECGRFEWHAQLNLHWPLSGLVWLFLIRPAVSRCLSKSPRSFCGTRNEAIRNKGALSEIHEHVSITLRRDKKFQLFLGKGKTKQDLVK